MASPTTPTASRALTNGDDDAVPGEDTSEVTKLFGERLAAWKHAVGYLEDYITATEKTHHAHGKEYERVLKVRDLATSMCRVTDVVYVDGKGSP
jgi:hypothetical protein